MIREFLEYVESINLNTIPKIVKEKFAKIREYFSFVLPIGKLLREQTKRRTHRKGSNSLTEIDKIKLNGVLNVFLRQKLAPHNIIY